MMQKTGPFNARRFFEYWESAPTVHHINLLKRDFAPASSVGRRTGHAVARVLSGGICEEDRPLSPVIPVPAAQRREEIDERIAREGYREELLKERARLLAAVLGQGSGLDESDADDAFVALTDTAEKLLALFAHEREACTLFVSGAVSYAEYYLGKMKEYNLAAERQARMLAEGSPEENCRSRVEETTRRALERGLRALAVLSGIEVPVYYRKKLHAGFEMRIEESFTIDPGVLLEASDDGTTAYVRADRRWELLKHVFAELCRSFVRLGAYDKAKMCEAKMCAVPAGYQPKNRHDIVAFEEENWASLFARPV